MYVKGTYKTKQKKRKDFVPDVRFAYVHIHNTNIEEYYNYVQLLRHYT